MKDVSLYMQEMWVQIQHCYFPFSDVLKADDYLKEALYKFHLKREIYRGDLNEIKEVIRGYQLWMDGCIAEFVPKLSI